MTLIFNTQATQFAQHWLHGVFGHACESPQPDLKRKTASPQTNQDSSGSQRKAYSDVQKESTQPSFFFSKWLAIGPAESQLGLGLGLGLGSG